MRVCVSVCGGVSQCFLVQCVYGREGKVKAGQWLTGWDVYLEQTVLLQLHTQQTKHADRGRGVPALVGCFWGAALLLAHS